MTPGPRRWPSSVRILPLWATWQCEGMRSIAAVETNTSGSSIDHQDQRSECESGCLGRIDRAARDLLGHSCWSGSHALQGALGGDMFKKISQTSGGMKFGTLIQLRRNW